MANRGPKALVSALTPDTVMLLTDGSLFVHHAYGKAFYRLAPDNQGRYESGTWSGPVNMANTRQFFASGVLMDGRVFAIGGEYSDAGNATPLGEIFDPVTNTWTALNKPAPFNFINSDAVDLRDMPPSTLARKWPHVGRHRTPARQA
jgi:hypothetical protein